MTLTQEARLDLAPDLLDEMELWFATAPREQVADMLAVWLYDAVHREIAIGTFNLVRFKSAVDAAVRRLWTRPVEHQEALFAADEAAYDRREHEAFVASLEADEAQAEDRNAAEGGGL